VFRLAADGKLVCLLDTIPSPNGLVLNRSESVVFVAVTRANAVWIVPMTGRGGVSKVGLFVQLPCPGPDGMALGADGSIAVAHPGLGVAWLFSNRGIPLYRVESCAGPMVTNLAYGGEGQRWLYMTESHTGTILRAEMPSAGQPMFSHS
jgi:gluconolactonase